MLCVPTRFAAARNALGCFVAEQQGTHMTTDYEIHLDGVHATDLPLGVLRDLVDLLLDGASRATRLVVEGRSIARGTTPWWLSESSELRMTALREGSLALAVSARPLAEVAPAIFGANTETETPVAAGETAVDLLMSAIDDALRGQRDSDRLDYGMLQTLTKSKSIFGRGATRLRISRGAQSAIEFGDEEVSTFQRLALETPAPKVDRVVGVLDSLTMSTRTAVLKLTDGVTLKGNVGANIDLESVKGLLGTEVLVEGTVAFRPSARPLRIEIDHVATATKQDIVWTRTPRGELGQQLILPVDAMSSYFGQWPGDEDDEQVFAALKELA